MLLVPLLLPLNTFTTLTHYLFQLIPPIDLVYFTTRVPDTSDTIATRTTQVRHDCDMNNTSATRVTRATRVWHKCDTNDTSATWAPRVWHKCDTSATRTTQVWHKCYKNDTSVTRVRNFDFDNDTSEKIFSHPYISYMANERLQGEEKFHSKNYLLEMPRSHAKMHLKSVPQKMNFAMAKAISKSCTLDCSCKCPCTFLHSCG